MPQVNKFQYHLVSLRNSPRLYHGNITWTILISRENCFIGFMYNLGGQKFQSVLSQETENYQYENLHKIITEMSRIEDLLTTSTMG